MSADQISIGIGDKRDIQPWRSRKTYCANEEVETGFALYIACFSFYLSSAMLIEHECVFKIAIFR